jgi:hypothetical protein
VPLRRGQPFSYWGHDYSPYYGSNLGLYSTWRYGYGASRWGYYPYGFGYGLFGYAPYAPYYYDPYLPFMYGYGGGYGGGIERDDDSRPTGSIRLRMTPRDARVYIDGALVGTVDEFDGLTHHLDIQAGRHQLEIRAAGYENYTTEVVVTAGKTMTERASLKKK